MPNISSKHYVGTNELVGNSMEVGGGKKLNSSVT